MYKNDEENKTPYFFFISARIRINKGQYQLSDEDDEFNRRQKQNRLLFNLS